MTRSLQATDFQRSRIIGFSVTNSMWSAFRAAVPHPETWELLWYSGGSIDQWARDPATFTGWLGNSGDPTNTGGLIDGVGGDTDPMLHAALVDRVVLNVSGLTGNLSDGYGTLGIGGYSSNVTQWLDYITTTLGNIRTVHPNVRLIYLQPQIGGVFGAETSCTTADSNASPFGVVRCCWSARYTRTAIAAAIAADTVGNVRPGFIQYADACSDYADWAGHLNTTPRATHGAAMAAHYASAV